MSERKILNKYYPPDFDAARLPKHRITKNRQLVIRIMSPMSMRCNECGEYIYKGKKFNARQETVRDDNYLGVRLYRFYIKCPRCVAEISFKVLSNPNTDRSRKF
ncbi:Coiled-coil domain-containing protein 94 [Thelohanellus kitauei]|uniref:Coiled-coil domain-containing protein 94 n=1 Tax=Thelohanellus kitauei TaxID=669202 RepID=A0A0C2IKC3_THEKT|nr:Coiled-coil domain-containing protein 94 [Thelohanellus kitauei]